jgi:hypothetical protein
VVAKIVNSKSPYSPNKRLLGSLTQSTRPLIQKSTFVRQFNLALNFLGTNIVEELFLPSSKDYHLEYSNPVCFMNAERANQ